MELDILMIVGLVGSDVIVEFKPNFNYPDWIKGKVVGISITDNLVQIFDETGDTKWIPLFFQLGPNHPKRFLFNL